MARTLGEAPGDRRVVSRKLSLRNDLLENRPRRIAFVESHHQPLAEVGNRRAQLEADAARAPDGDAPRQLESRDARVRVTIERTGMVAPGNETHPRYVVILTSRLHRPERVRDDVTVDADYIVAEFAKRISGSNGLPDCAARAAADGIERGLL